MPKAVLTTRVDPTYDDLPEVRYHFPHTYLNTIMEALGDWIVYYEPRRLGGNLSTSGGRQSYFATARLVRVERDPGTRDHYYAFVEDYLEFDRAVSVQGARRAVLLRALAKKSRWFHQQRSVRASGQVPARC